MPITLTGAPGELLYEMVVLKKIIYRTDHKCSGPRFNVNRAIRELALIV